MAVDLDQLVNNVSALLNAETGSIEVYRANFATPSDLVALRFWAQNEYNRIQSGFASTEEAVTLLASSLTELIQALDELATEGTLQGPPGAPGLQGAPGPAGEDGQDGRDGQDATAADLINDNTVALSTTWSSQKIDKTIDSDISSALLATKAGLRWIDYVTSYITTPVQLATIGAGDVFQYDYANMTLYRLVGTTDDAFYSNWDGVDVSGIISNKGNSI